MILYIYDILYMIFVALQAVSIQQTVGVTAQIERKSMFAQGHVD